MMRFIILFMVSPFFLMASSHQKYENLGNPVQYTFDFPIERVRIALDEITPARIGDIVTFKLSRSSGVLRGFTLDTGYYKQYWDGPIEHDEDVNPPEAGKIGEVSGAYDLKITSAGEGTHVVVLVSYLEQQIGRHYSIFPHFRKTGTRVKIKSDTYFEYLFLSKLGALLGQKGMPPLNDGTGKPVDINTIPLTKLAQ